MADAQIDIEEVAKAIKEMFEASASGGEQEPDLVVIRNILKEEFPGITADHITQVAAILRGRL